MSEILYEFLINLSPNISSIAFFIAIGVIFLLFLALLILILIKPNLCIKTKCFFLAISCGIIILELAISVILWENLGASLICFGILAILFSIIFAIPKKQIKVTNSQREFITNLDKAVYGENNQGAEQPQDKASFDEEVKTLKCKPLAKQATDNTIDYTHIKNIISRLDYFGLSGADKNLISQLELNILQAERGEDSLALKQNINEGLGALLKIMSKYGA